MDNATLWGAAATPRQKLGERLSAWRLAGVLAVVTLSATLAGCGMSSLTSGLGGGMFGSSSTSGTAGGDVSEEALLTAAKSGDTATTGSTNVGEISGGCPRMVLASRDNNITFYEPGRAGDGLAIMHRGEITKTARECQVEPGRVTVKYGFSGRVLLGPRGKPGSITLPVNVTVTDSKRAPVTGQHMNVDVVVGADKPIGYFSAVQSITFDIPEGTRPGEFEVTVGFDPKAAGAG
ncbi:MAG: hypothetical protein AB7S74_08375 [Hyphomicrobium sp.]